jgi:HK97 family phage prohead protease
MKPKTIDEIRKSLPSRERRDIPGHVEVREDGDEPTIGIFIPFNSRSVELYGFTEIIAPGAFTRTIANGRKAKRGGDIKALWQHNSSDVLGRQANRTLDLVETDKGLEAEVIVAPDKIRWHGDALASIQRGDVDGSSFGFETVKDEWEYSEDGSATRTLVECKLFEVSPVTFPAYPGSESEKRSVLDAVMVRHGIDTRALAALLEEATDGLVPAAKAEGLQTWITRLQGFLPSPVEPTVTVEAPGVDWNRKLDLRMRGLVA